MTGLSLSQILRAEAPSGRRATAKNVILLFQFGGRASGDLRPGADAPAEIRGELARSQRRGWRPGLRAFAAASRLANQYALIRSVHHRSSSHNPGAYYSLTGREPLINKVTLNATALDFPHPGSIVSYLDKQPRQVPPFVSLPTMIADGPFRTPGEFAGFLGKMHDPLWVLRDPNAADFNVEELALPTGVDVERAGERKDMWHELDARSRLADRIAAVRGMNDYQGRAAGSADVESHSQGFRHSGRIPADSRSLWPQHLWPERPSARRLVEAGVRFVTVYYSRGISGWDYPQRQLQHAEKQPLAAHRPGLVGLAGRSGEPGLLSETLVYWTGDFGRTPKINKDAGRDHWPPCQTVLMAGGGIRGGQVYGARMPRRLTRASNLSFPTTSPRPSSTLWDSIH